MMREVTWAIALLSAALILAPVAPAQPAAPCDPLVTLERAVQDDAGSGADAPDAASDALRVPRDGYYWGYLSPVGHEAADRFDWYEFVVPADTDLFMTNVTANYTLVYVQTFTLTLWTPDGAVHTTDSQSPTIAIEDPAPGLYAIRLGATTLYDVDVCTGGEAAGLGAAGSAASQNHGLYVGCNPVCVVR